jgi:hypothetical protein
MGMSKKYIRRPLCLSERPPLDMPDLVTHAQAEMFKKAGVDKPNRLRPHAKRQKKAFARLKEKW